MSVPIVAEFGSSSTRFGYAGEDRPTTVLPSCYGIASAPISCSGVRASSGSPARFSSPARHRKSPSKRQRLSSPSASRPRPNPADYVFGSKSLLSFKEGGTISSSSSPPSSALKTTTPALKIHPLIEKGQVRDWAAIESLWQSILAQSCHR